MYTKTYLLFRDSDQLADSDLQKFTAINWGINVPCYGNTKMGSKTKCPLGRKNGKEYSRKDVPRQEGEEDYDVI